MLKRLVVISSVMFVLAVGATAVSAQWESLGEKEVKDASEQDTWHLGPQKGEFRKIKIAVLERPVRFYRLEVTFVSGGKQQIQLRNVIQAGGESRAIDLEGKDRYIAKVDVWYEASTVRRGKRSHVILYGQK